MTEQLKEWIYSSKNTVFFGGAGVSTECGIPDFRSAGGLYRSDYGGAAPEQIISAEYFAHHTELFYQFYREKMLFPGVQPGKAHRALAALERDDLLSCVITQNIDGLHQAAGSQNVLELHGTVHQNRCVSCGKMTDLNSIYQSRGVPRCTDCGGMIKPCVTLYGEMLPEGVFEAAIQAVCAAELLIIGGTSLTVYPAAGLVSYFTGKHLVILNKDATPADLAASLVIRDPVGEVLYHVCGLDI